MMTSSINPQMRRTMKKFFILAGALIATVALSSCQKEQEANENTNTPKTDIFSIPFELVADIETPSTKTTLDPGTWDVSWDNGDVIYVVTEDEEWGEAAATDEDGDTIAEYTYSSSTNSFTTGSTISDGDHVFNFLYSNGTQKTYHRGAGTSHQLTASQTFDGNTPTGNIKAYDALVGQLEATTPTTLANIEMSHLYSLMKVTLKNKTGAAITASSFDISVKDKNIAGVFNVTFGATPSISLKNSGSSTITVTISNGSIANNGTLDLFFVMAPFSSYTGAMQFKLTDSNSKVYQQNNALAGVTFNAGAYYTSSFTLKAGSSVQSFDLSTDTTESASTDALTWKDNKFRIRVDKESSTTPANNYYPGTAGKTYTSTRFYTNSVLTVTPPSGCTIKAIDFTATSTGYATTFAGSSWTNGTAYNYGTVVTVVPTDGASAVSATIGGTCGFTDVDIYYTGTPDPRTESSLSFANATVNTDTANYGSCTGQTATASPNVDAIKNNLTYSVKSDPNGIVSSIVASTGVVTLNGTKGSAVIKVQFDGDVDYTPATAEYTINVADPTYSVTYTVTSKTAVSTTGTAPAGSSATYSQTYSTVSQATNGNSFTLTLTGFDGKTITAASVSVHSNSSGGKGSLSLVSGSDSIASISDSNFNTSNWNGSYTSSWVTKNLTVTQTTVGDSKNVVLTISATANSLYFQSLTLSYK